MRTVIAVACIVVILASSSLLLAQETMNINTMTKSQMMALKCGLGEVKAQRVVDEREKGEFASFADLQARVSGVGPKTAEKLQSKGVVCIPSQGGE